MSYKEIFYHYGLYAPEQLALPTISEINDYADSVKTSFYKAPTQNELFFSTLSLCLLPRKSFKIHCLDRFCEAFGVQIDQSRIHPDFIRSLNFMPQLSSDKVVITAGFVHRISLCPEDERDLYLSHFLPEYPLQKLFSSGSVEETRSLFILYLGKTVIPEFVKLDLTPFLSELYRLAVHRN